MESGVIMRANSEDADQPAHSRSLIRILTIHDVISLDANR